MVLSLPLKEERETECLHDALGEIVPRCGGRSVRKCEMSR